MPGVALAVRLKQAPTGCATGPVNAVRRTSVVPIGRGTLVLVLAPVVLPLLMVVALQIPVREILKVVLKAVA